MLNGIFETILCRPVVRLADEDGVYRHGGRETTNENSSSVVRDEGEEKNDHVNEDVYV